MQHLLRNLCEVIPLLHMYIIYSNHLFKTNLNPLHFFFTCTDIVLKLLKHSVV